MNEILSKIKTPAYVCEEAKVRKNLELLKRVKIESGAKVLVALKGFAFSGVMGLVGEYLDGATCSGLHEAKFAASSFKLCIFIGPKNSISTINLPLKLNFFLDFT